ncbi:hypothetical protein EWB00_010837 [Schistosoma japonicum]|uniref:SJCHGC02583 protein n=1 Tax=Schistosoma japonicum TaxID=6182 RepID=Q5DH24_SCHJA|nr:SJCHGC02583 protein [Schistosoma japonicum]KAH8864113.1 hypothetical protein KSF78_0002887 [Schistosoma japonicum]KAH8864114.1 hypothetical protein KSF78_0002887 [Schistosoma japonicum]KAH8864115.1 hypothetical protein KSF78_0002887 [Schistosoma japonicum]KAH8864116.1 hypothetical protein KSF78_0002887 [Schistosoma japonicum]
MNETNLKPNLDRFVNINNNLVNKSVTVVEDSKPAGVYKPSYLAPVFFAESKNKSSVDRAKLRAARFILEDTDFYESEDLPKEVYFGCGSEESFARRKMKEKQNYEEENLIRLKTSKQEKRINRSLLPGGLSDTSSRLRQMQILLQSSDEEMKYKPPPTKKKKKQLKRLRYKKGRRKQN